MRPDVDGHLDRVLLATAKRFKLELFALRALLEATRLLGLVMAEWLRERRDSGEPVQELASSVKLQAYLLTVAQETIELLGARWDKVPPRQRPHYGPEQRYRILRIKTELGLSATDTAHRFRVSTETVERWQQEAMAHSDRETVGSLVKPEPPVRRFADVVRHLVQQMAASSFGGSEMIAKVLTRAGWRMSKRSVGRVRKERPAPNPAPTPEPSRPERDRSVVARYPGHVLSLDLTDIPALFRVAAFKLVLVIDLWSRMPLAARLFPGDPTGAEVAASSPTLRVESGRRGTW